MKKVQLLVACGVPKHWWQFKVHNWRMIHDDGWGGMRCARCGAGGGAVL